ncbi:MAG: thymidylate kinase [Ruminococcus sp.]|nr:thymidylate kinase [Ruminococcus sp.]
MIREKNKGRLIVIDGLDGCGKSTQLELVFGKLNGGNASSNGRNVRRISFPDYGMPSSALVKMYLAGEFSENADGVNPYAASTFYAADRYASFKLKWERDYLKGDIILSGRYVCSNAIHQTPKLPPEQWDGFLDWLADYEYEKLALPRPDKTILLDITPELSQERLSARYGGDESKKDIHESSAEYMGRCREAALYAARRQGWDIVSCSDETGASRSENEISQMILDLISGVI